MTWLVAGTESTDHAHDRGGSKAVTSYADVIAGQRTLAVEIGARMRGPMTIACPVGGGGLLAGVARWASEHPDVRVVGVEVAASRALSAAVRVGHVVDVPVGPTLADGMAGAWRRARSRSRSRAATFTI